MSHAHEHHSHSHQHEVEPGNSSPFIIGICLNLAFVITEIIAGLYYNSLALLTDAGHNASDVASLALSLIAFWMSRQKSSARYMYGFNFCQYTINFRSFRNFKNKNCYALPFATSGFKTEN